MQSAPFFLLEHHACMAERRFDCSAAGAIPAMDDRQGCAHGGVSSGSQPDGAVPVRPPALPYAVTLAPPGPRGLSGRFADRRP